MSNFHKAIFISSASLLAISTQVRAESIVGTNDAPAPEVKTSASDEGDIVVTARRRNERLQEVPLSVTAYSGEALKERGIENVSDLASTTPGLRIDNFSNRSALIINIRGQMQTNLDASLDPSVGIYVDGIYVPKLYGANAGLVDIQSLQVLRGPQGTLFGRNTPGGAILITTADPTMEGIHGNASFRMGSYGQRDLEAVLNIPLIDDVLAVRGAIKRVRSDGWARNMSDNGRRLADDHRDNYRVKLLFTPTPDIRLVLSADRFKLDERMDVSYVRDFTPGGALDNFIKAQSGGTASAATYANPSRYVANYNPITTSLISYEFQSSGDNRTITQVDQYVGNLQWTFSKAAALEVIVGHRKTDGLTRFDLDATPYSFSPQVTGTIFKQTSAEARLSGIVLNGHLNYTTGLYYFTEKGRDSGQYQDTDAYAVFGQGTYTFSDKLSATGGIRYSKDHKRPTATAKNGNGTCGVPVVLRQDPDICRAQFDYQKGSVTYTASLEYKPVMDILLYAKTSSGTRSGGYNVRVASANLNSFLPFKPEKIVEYEIGAKTQFLDRRLTLNISAYYDDYKVAQRNSTVLNPDGTLASRVTSTAKGRVKGIEADANLDISRQLSIGGTLALTDAKYTRFFDQTITGAVVERTGEPFSRTPDYSYSLNFAFRQPLAFGHTTGQFTARADWSFTDSLSSVSSAVRAGTLPALTQKAFGLLNGRLEMSFDNGFGVAVSGTNLLNKDYQAAAIDIGSAIIGFRGVPRKLFIEGNYRF